MIKFSIIIPCRSINAFLRENISNLKKLNYHNFEVVIVLDEKENYDFSGDERFKIVESGQKGPGEKRNIGADFATGKILAFLDDDAYPSANWLAEAEKLFDRRDIYALGAPAVTPKNVEFLERCSGYVLESWLTFGNVTYRNIPGSERVVVDYPTVNLFVTKDAFNEIGGFFTEFWPGEDTKLCLDLVKRYKRPFLYSPLPVVYHHRRTLFSPHLKQISRYGKHRGQFVRLFPESSRVVYYFVPSLFVLGIFFGPLVGLYFSFLLNVYLFVLFVYLILILFEGFLAAMKDRNLKTGLYVGVGIALTHFVYGINFIIGLIRKPELKLKAFDLKTGNYLEG